MGAPDDDAHRQDKLIAPKWWGVCALGDPGKSGSGNVVVLIR